MKEPDVAIIPDPRVPCAFTGAAADPEPCRHFTTYKGINPPRCGCYPCHWKYLVEVSKMRDGWARGGWQWGWWNRWRPVTSDAALMR